MAETPRPPVQHPTGRLRAPRAEAGTRAETGTEVGAGRGGGSGAGVAAEASWRGPGTAAPSTDATEAATGSPLARCSRWFGQLPRATRDTLFLLGVLAWTLLPHLQQVPVWCGVATVAALLWRTRVAVLGQALPPRWVLVVALLLACATAGSAHSGFTSKDAGVTLLVLLSALKTLELRARRDAIVIFFLGFVLVLTNFLYSQSLLVAVAMLGSVLGLLTALLLSNLPDLPAEPGRPGAAPDTPGVRLAAGLALRQVLIGAPLVVVLFLLFPRLPPLWGVAGEGLGRTGLSDRMELGQVAELAGDDSLAMRVRFLGESPPKDALYFRGPVLTRFDGRSWQTLPDFGVEKTTLVRGATIAYEMTVEPLRVASLPLLETTIDPPQVEGANLRLSLRDDLHWQPDRLITDRLLVRAHASIAIHHASGRLPLLREEQLALPPGASPRTRAWAQRWQEALAERLAGTATPLAPAGTTRYADQMAQAVLDHIRQADYHYTLTPGPVPAGADPIDSFWLDNRAGFCEHYAASFVVILRSLGIPARIVTGYLGGQVNPMDGLLDLRQSDAHAWTEYWRPGFGWVRADPTGAVAPERIQQSQRPTPRRGLLASTLSQVSPGLVLQWQDLRDVWTALEQRWNEGVLNYSSQRQRDLLEGLGLEQVDATVLFRLLGGGLAALALAGAGWAAWQQRQRRLGDPWLRDWRDIQAQLSRQGWPVPAQLSPLGVAALISRTSGHAPAQTQPLGDLLAAFERLRYGLATGSVRTRRQLRAAIVRAVRSLPAPGRAPKASTSQQQQARP